MTGISPFMARERSRLKTHTKKAPIKENLASLKVRVMEAGVLYRQIESVIPRE